MFHKEKEVLRQIAKASDAIRRKHRMLKIGKEDAENMLSETFRPIVTPLEKLVNLSNIPVEHKIETKFEKHEQDKEEEEKEEEKKTIMKYFSLQLLMRIIGSVIQLWLIKLLNLLKIMKN